MSENNNTRIHIQAVPLRLNLKFTFCHASASRSRGESVWVRVERKGITGFGEGCPRTYSTGDDLASSLVWINELIATDLQLITCFPEMVDWVNSNQKRIDSFPSAWCAIELALLDLFAREQGISCESILGLQDFKRIGRYTAVLSDSSISEFKGMADLYFSKGFYSYKLKLNGNIAEELKRVEILKNLADQHGISNIRIRLDANNLWKGSAEEAIKVLKYFKNQVVAIEEPVGVKNFEDINRVIEETGIPVILDESLTRLEDLQQIDNDPAMLIANIKLSRLGGMLRSLRVIDEVKKLGWRIIVGCHVGETSVLTRAALVAGVAAGKNLIGQEGAFGDYLVAAEPVQPVLTFGQGGILNLDQPYRFNSSQGETLVSVDNWNSGFGLNCFLPEMPPASDSHLKETA